MDNTNVVRSLSNNLIKGFDSVGNLFQALGNASSAGAHVTKAWEFTAESYEDSARHARNTFNLENESKFAALEAKLNKTKA